MSPLSKGEKLPQKSMFSTEATPQMPDLINVEGCIVTIDAMGTQK
jgi:predicted transposase YbfD/YdcC